jgi:uncharacterized protein YndB with AHSA1/START domain
LTDICHYLRVRFERHFNHDRAKVWRALTESEHLTSWMPCDIVGERRAGARIELPFWPDHVEKYGLDAAPLHGEIRVWDPPSVFEWTWETDVLRWGLTPENGGTNLRFTTWLADDPTGCVTGRGRLSRRALPTSRNSSTPGARCA